MESSLIVRRLDPIPWGLNYYKREYQMKRTLEDTGAGKDTGVDYFKKARISEPIESLGIKELQKRIEDERKKKNHRPKPSENF